MSSTIDFFMHASLMRVVGGFITDTGVNRDIESFLKIRTLIHFGVGEGEM